MVIISPRVQSVLSRLEMVIIVKISDKRVRRFWAKTVIERLHSHTMSSTTAILTIAFIVVVAVIGVYSIGVKTKSSASPTTFCDILTGPCSNYSCPYTSASTLTTITDTTVYPNRTVTETMTTASNGILTTVTTTTTYQESTVTQTSTVVQSETCWLESSSSPGYFLPMLRILRFHRRSLHRILNKGELLSIKPFNLRKKPRLGRVARIGTHDRSSDSKNRVYLRNEAPCSSMCQFDTHPSLNILLFPIR